MCKVSYEGLDRTKHASSFRNKDDDDDSPVMKSMVQRAKEGKFWTIADAFKVVRVN